MNKEIRKQNRKLRYRKMNAINKMLRGRKRTIDKK
jgi:hypothetical protein